mmetsp:Transcript_5115/g.9372  ORF Transcript_5115/g.9372 Transcript_5115/m.9372 type:complete len:141 (+) Transcript_5115:98-520(+)
MKLLSVLTLSLLFQTASAGGPLCTSQADCDALVQPEGCSITCEYPREDSSESPFCNTHCDDGIVHITSSCVAKEDCPDDAGEYCGYDCLDGSCLLWCEGGGEEGTPCEIDEDCGEGKECSKAVRRKLFGQMVEGWCVDAY